MKLDTDKNGLEALFRSWQVPLVEELFKRTLTSREAYDVLEDLGVKAGKKEYGSVSRASVINLLNYLVDAGLLDFDLKTGKGGHHRIYKMTLTRKEFAHKTIDLFVDKLIEVFPKESKTFLWPEP